MKILAVSYDYPPIIGGIASHVHGLYQAMAEDNHDIHILTKTPHSYKDGRVNIYPLPKRIFRPLYGRQINAQINRLCKTLDPDIIHLHGLLPLSGLTPKPAPIVYTNHTSGYLQRIEKGGRHIKKLERLFRPIDLLLAPSTERLETPFAMDAPKKFIPNGVVAETFMRNESTRNNLRQQFNIKEDEPLAIITSRLEPVKGILDLAIATQYIQHPKLKLLIIGGGTQEAAIETTLKQNFAGRYIMTGAIPHAQIAPYYSAADFAILPSLMEATSISCLEAMAARLPTIASNVGGLTNLVCHNETGILCLPQNPKALAEAIDNLLTQDMQKMGAAAQTRIEQNFTWKKSASDTLNAYRQLL